MKRTEVTGTEHRRKQAATTVLIALMIAFSGAMLGVIFGIAHGDMATPEAVIIALCIGVTGSLIILVLLNPAIATSVITGAFTVYLVFHLNAGAIVAYSTSGELVRTIPYITWFFPLVIFHQFTNFGRYKRGIGLLVNSGPIPTAAYVLTHIDTPIVGVLDAIVTFLFSFLAFVLFVGFFTRHRDEEVMSAAMAEEAELSAEALRVSEERFRLLGLATRDLIWDADLKSRNIWWSDSLLDVYGYDPRNIGMDFSTWESWIHSNDRARVLESLQAVIDSGKNKWTNEYRFVSADGRALEVIGRALVLRDSLGEAVRLIGSTTDVTEVRDLERRLQQAQKMEAIGHLTGGVAHDFNNLLTVIMGNAEILAEQVVDKKLVSFAEATLSAAERGAELTNRLLAFARRQPLNPRPTDVNSLIRSMWNLLRRTLPESIDLEFVSDPDLGMIEIDAAELDNALLNLVFNARDVLSDGGRVMIETANVLLDQENAASDSGIVAGEYVMICVSDTGTGMDAATVQRAVEPFFTTKEVGKGSGLGLSMVFGFTKQSGGHLRIYSELGEGTAIKLYFPRVNIEKDADFISAINVPLKGGIEQILIVEDDELVLEHVENQLVSLGYRVTTALSGRKALDILKARDDIDLLLTDIVMPGGVNGRELAELALADRPTLKVLFTSGYAENAIIHHGRLDPGVAFLSKPYTRLELAKKVRSVLDHELGQGAGRG